MAQISSISSGEAMSTVRTKLNNVITEINLLDPTDWVDYSATSTIVGWSSFTNKQIRYRIIGKQLIVQVFLQGTSNSTATTFTVPNNCVNILSIISNYGINNGASQNQSYFQSAVNSNVISCLQSGTATWTASGTKAVIGQFFIEIA